MDWVPAAVAAVASTLYIAFTPAAFSMIARGAVFRLFNGASPVVMSVSGYGGLAA